WARQSAGLVAALRAGLAVLAGGGPAVDAVVTAVSVMEDAEEWNAGRGSALTAAGTVEMDAAVAEGRTGRIGAVACVTGVRHPVAAARAVLDDGRHVLLAGRGAEAFARAAGLRFEPDDWFIVERRRRDLARCRPAAPPARPAAAGRLAAATSTGGRTGQLPGRVGDSPIPGAGTWADGVCAVSATGVGEAFLRAAFAHEVDARIRLAGADLDTACREALAAVAAAGGDGGCIAVAGAGPPVLPFTTALMHRGWAEVGGVLRVGAGPGPLQETR